VPVQAACRGERDGGAEGIPHNMSIGVGHKQLHEILV
jgi:hypothetical protein